MDISINRASVCMGDDVESHAILYPVHPSDRFSDVFRALIQRGYFPAIAGNDVVWTLFCGKDDLISWKTKEDAFYSRLPPEEPPILSVRRWADEAAVSFRYYSPPIARARYLYRLFGGKTFQMEHQGFLAEYESFQIPRAVEESWRHAPAPHALHGPQR